MRTGAFERLLARYGQAVLVHDSEAAGVPVRAFLQPILERGGDRQQDVPTPLGHVRRDRFLYLGPASVPMDSTGDGFLTCHGMEYEVQTAQVVYVGEKLSHCWAVLRLRDTGVCL